MTFEWLPESTLCPSLSLSFTKIHPSWMVQQFNQFNMLIYSFNWFKIYLIFSTAFIKMSCKRSVRICITDASLVYLYYCHNPTTSQKNLHLNQKGSWMNYWHPSDWWMILSWSGFKVYPCVLNFAGHNPTKFTLNMELNLRYCLFHIYNYMGTS